MIHPFSRLQPHQAVPIAGEGNRKSVFLQIPLGWFKGKPKATSPACWRTPICNTKGKPQIDVVVFGQLKHHVFGAKGNQTNTQIHQKVARPFAATWMASCSCLFFHALYPKNQQQRLKKAIATWCVKLVHPIPSHPIPSHPIPSHPIHPASLPSHPIPHPSIHTFNPRPAAERRSVAPSIRSGRPRRLRARLRSPRAAGRAATPRGGRWRRPAEGPVEMAMGQKLWRSHFGAEARPKIPPSWMFTYFYVYEGHRFLTATCQSKQPAHHPRVSNPLQAPGPGVNGYLFPVSKTKCLKKQW